MAEIESVLQNFELVTAFHPLSFRLSIKNEESDGASSICDEELILHAQFTMRTRLGRNEGTCQLDDAASVRWWTRVCDLLASFFYGRDSLSFGAFPGSRIRRSSSTRGCAYTTDCENKCRDCRKRFSRSEFLKGFVSRLLSNCHVIPAVL